MARRGGENAEASRPQGRDNAPGVRALPTQTFARIAILSTLLLLAVYTAFAVARIQREPQVTTAANSALPSRAEALAAHLDAEAAALRGGLLATREALQRDGDQTMAAAESGLRAGAGAAVAVAVISDDEVVAVAGPPGGLDWLELAKSAADSKREVWQGVTSQSAPALAAATTAATSKGQRWIVVAGDPTHLGAWLSKTKPEAIATPEGSILAASPANGVGAADTVNAAFATTPQVRPNMPYSCRIALGPTDPPPGTRAPPLRRWPWRFRRRCTHFLGRATSMSARRAECTTKPTSTHCR